MPITDWPKEDRPREKLLANGEKRLTDAELIAIFLKTGTRGKTALDLAKDLLREFGSLKKLLRMPASVLVRQHGLGIAKYAALKAGVELGRRYFNALPSTGMLIRNSKMTGRFLVNRLGDYPNEVFACLFLDNRCRLICFEELFQGTINEANVYPREIIRRGLFHNAAKIILAHNHPSGIAVPSEADKTVTLVIRQALALVDICVIDHIIVGNGQHFSFADAGLI